MTKKLHILLIFSDLVESPLEELSTHLTNSANGFWLHFSVFHFFVVTLCYKKHVSLL